ncbi:DUF4493 domain-containing protein [Bacteroides gallinaceum]|uniref:DUF4493 domain-containing protein n=1 Tax=Bacteroides gallinaceum TaxID=1462571 RepID=UPI00195C8408|nr:DUF4493 domain-containing protein [Bacteroides gallinaceum]MBM6658667.1 DUF4493 domain-containing protein [Bacteroides gallinaceum]
MNKVKFLVATLLGVLFVACSEEENLSQTGKTGFLVSLAEDVKVESRSTPEEIGKPVASQFNLKITNQATGSELYNDSYTNQLIPASAGMYEIEATYGDNPVLALDAPYYKGTAEADLADGESKTVQVNCKVANALASVEFDNSGTNTFESQFVSYGVRVSVNTSVTTLTNDGKSAYYRAGSMPVFTFVGTLRKGGGVKEVPLGDSNLSSPSTFAAGKHCRITLKLSDAAPGLRVEISKVEVDSVTINETIPLEWLPKPKVTAEGFTDNTLFMYETETPTAKFNFNLSSALQELKFTLNLADETYQSLNKTYTLSELSEEDRTALTNAGVVLPVIGSKEASLDFTGLAAKLTGSTTGDVLSNVITLDEVKANNRVLEGEQVYTIQTSAPDFELIVYPGNTWTKQFTANTQIIHGNADVIRKGMTFEYSTDGIIWTPAADSLITELIPGTTYQIQGKFGKHISKIVDVKTYEVLTIPNSTLDDGYDTTYPKDDNPLYSFIGDWIDTRNELTCHSDGVNAFYVSKSSTLPINDNGSTVAHMMVIGWGAGNSCAFGNKTGSVIGNISSGIVCVGDYDASSDVINAKEAYIRPTSLTFTYKASPYNGDEYLVEVVLLNITDGVETIIGEGILQSGNTVNDYSTQSIDINYDDSALELPISHVKVLFKAGTKEDRDHLEDKFRDASLLDGYVNAYIIGSQFWLDSFQFNYDK